jgi:cyclohexanecarboxyl-CoA dehydrogenase
MDPTFSDTERMLRDTLHDYAIERLLPEYLRWKREPYPRDRLADLGRLGVLGLRVPAEYGGSGAGHVAVGIAAEELSRGDFTTSYFLQIQGVAAALMGRGATEDLKRRWLPALSSGECMMAFALTEPGVGSDAARLTTSARLEGEEFVLNGEKASITFAGTADVCLVFARTGAPGARGISLILVPLDVAGVSRHVYAPAGDVTQRGSLRFDDVRVPADHRLGEEGSGFIGAMQAFDFNRAVIGLACVGAAQQSVDETVEYTKVRQAFDKPLARHEAVAFQIAEHQAFLHAARLLSYQVLALADAGEPHTAESAMCKWLAPKLAVEAIHACVLLHGWIGYGDDLPLMHRLRDVMGLEIADGTPEIMKAVIARETFGPDFSSYK